MPQNDSHKSQPNIKTTLTVRELIQQLANCEDMDAEMHTSLFNSDPVPVVSIEADEGTGQVIIGT